MNRAFRYDGKDLDRRIADALAERSINGKSATTFMKNHCNRSGTENGAAGFRTTGHPLADLNFMVSSLRNRDENDIVYNFIKAYYDSPLYAVKWLFFLRDILEGLGERRTFRICMRYMAESHTEIARVLIPLVPVYGRYDDLLVFLETELCDDVCRFMKTQLEADLQAMKEEKSVSLLAKWLPSVNASSKETRKRALLLARKFGMNEKVYRKVLSALRSYINVVEVQMSASKWAEIEYGKVPAKANLKYEAAFERHDKERRMEYLWNTLSGRAKLNGKGIMPYEIVHRLLSKSGRYCWGGAVKDDLLAEIMWKKILEHGFQNEWGFEDCIVVADGSGSMYSYASGSTTVTAIEICNSLAIYFAEQLQGVFHNKAITFSNTPQFIDLEKGKSLKEKLEIMFAHCEISNTNIEAVFEMLLAMAVSHQVPADQIPKQVLVISDMEFDAATTMYRGKSQTLFDTIDRHYKEAGYKMPRLIFWNVCGRTNTIPQVQGESGVCLLSGFSQNATKIAADKTQKDPYESLLSVLDGKRYDAVEEALKAVAA